MRKLKTIFYYLPAFLFLLPLVFSKRDLVLLPNEKKLNLKTYNDASDGGGNSTSSITKATNSEIVFDFTLQTFHPSQGIDPYAALEIILTETDSFVDISPYTHLCIDLIANHSASFFMYLKTFIEGFTVFGNFRTYHFESYQALVHIGSKRYLLPLKDFKPPDWWHKEVGLKAQNLPQKPDNTKLFGIEIKSGFGTQIDRPEKFTITKIAFTTDRTGIMTIAFGGFFAYLLGALLFSFFSRRRRWSRPMYQQLVIANRSDDEANRLMTYIGTHFQEPNLTVEQVGRETGITPARIPVILQQTCNKAFKHYLNDIRITEAKRFLKETDRTIAEIAFTVGYNNVSHFNRVFRQEAGIPPTAFRGNSKK